MKTRTILLTGALALGAVGAATAAVNTCPMPTKKPLHHVAAYHARPRAVTRRVQVLANEAAPSYAERPTPPAPERDYVAAAYPPPVYEEPYPAYYPAPYAYGPVVYGYGGPYWGGPYWGGHWGHGWHGGGHWRR